LYLISLLIILLLIHKNDQPDGWSFLD